MLIYMFCCVSYTIRISTFCVAPYQYVLLRHLCYHSSVSVPKLSLRLSGGRTAAEGRLEVQYNGEWGTVCDDGWNTNSGLVACRQLGYNFSIRSTSSQEFGPGTGSILLDNVECKGNEENLFECDHFGLGVHNCDHDEDIGIVCSSE